MKIDLINGIECRNVKVTEAGFLLVADGRNQFTVQTTSMVSVERCFRAARLVGVED